MFSDNDLAYIEGRGSDLNTVEKQMENFKKGFPFLKILKPATKEDGIKVLSEPEVSNAADYYTKKAVLLSIVKFVPASGAASRMFKDLFNFLDNYDGSDDDYSELVNGEKYKPVYTFFKNITDFAFFQSLKSEYEKDGNSLEEDLLKRKYKDVLKTLLDDNGLEYGSLPKGLLEFHRYEDKSRTPIEEHLVEGALYSKGASGNVKIHFTVSPEHLEKFKAKIEDIRKKFEDNFKVTYAISYSEQKPSTDTIAVDPNNKPFREVDGKILFRPGGHGALIENLNEIDDDIVFVKNIDNVVPDNLKGTTVTYKKALAGKLLEVQGQTFNYLKRIGKGETDSELLEEITDFLKNELCIRNIPEFHMEDERLTFIKSKLNRPIRVCGMVKNEGEPGGGPFFAKNQDGTYSLQIVETSQINMEDKEQKDLHLKSTHFNPVDLVLGVKDYKGDKFDLTRYVDPETGFISKKSKDGKELQAQELPGLWNGAMSDWNTIFIEVPILTFNPVKTVNDLLRANHQNAKI